jgi:hypothetical protein
MGFLKNIMSAFKGASFRPTVESIGPLAAVIAPMKQGNVQPALQLWNASMRDPELRFRLVDATATMFGDEDSRTALLDAWAKNTPQDPFARLVRARWRILSQPRWTPNDPEEVADRARAAHTAAGKESLADYERVAQQLPQDPVPWTMMLQLSMVNELDGKKRLYGEVHHRHPSFFPAHLAMHHALSAMWYGDHEQSVGFMRGVAAPAPIGSDLHVLVVYAHLRTSGYEEFYGEGPTRARAILDDPQTNAEIGQALERSLWSPQYRPGYWSLWARHVAAMWFNERGDKPRAKAELERCGEFFDEGDEPWNMSTADYVEIRKGLGL